MNQRELTRLLRSLQPRDAEYVDGWFTPAERRRLLQTITSRPRSVVGAGRLTITRGSRIRRWRLLVAAASFVLVVSVGATFLLTGTQPRVARAAVIFRTGPTGAVFATVVNPFAEQQQLNAAFAHQGLSITVKLMPVPPSLVGTVLGEEFFPRANAAGDTLQPLHVGHCGMGQKCPIGIKISPHFVGRAVIGLGRPARPGEAYAANRPGTPTHASAGTGQTAPTRTSSARSADIQTSRAGQIEPPASGLPIIDRSRTHNHRDPRPRATVKPSATD